MAEQRIAVDADQDGPGGRLQPLREDGQPADRPERVRDLAAAMAEREYAQHPRWVWAATEDVYPRLLPRLPESRLGRCHDAKLVEPLLLAHEGRYGEPRSLGAAWARLQGLPVPEDLRLGLAEAESDAHAQDALFAPDRSRLGPGVDPLTALVAVHAEQQRRLAALPEPTRRGLRLLSAAESAGGLVAAELTYDGLPWSTEVHDALLEELLGSRPTTAQAAGGARPPKLAALAVELQDALGGRPLNPDSPGQVLRAFAEQGVSLQSTRNYLLRQVDHPAAPLLLRYKELSRIYAAHGWAWRDAWVRGGRFRPEYVVGGVVSGRWASRGGGALQIPRILRGAVVADPGWRLVVADAGQLEPRVLSALSNDPGLIRAGAAGDLYAGLAADAFGGDRARAKLGLLGAMYGQTSGEVGPLLAVLRRRFPQAMGLVEAAARTGESGGVVESRLGRLCPPPSASWQEAGFAEPSPSGELGEDRTGSAARSRGRFTRNFVIQASAADWALALIAALRRRLGEIPPGPDGARPRLVFFQHDEIVVHSPLPLTGTVAAAVAASADEARRLVFGDTPVRFPMDTHIVERYADAKDGGDAQDAEADEDEGY
ncbi:bifunctional 3'-5' exonuclease/DNA polymerase [Streptacidiphilus fuscans]|uniref:bifunctional 3'-5' exonuclease/DNA polymerase n=1 Tax=Streptacidiphilus fuscans TaxID=2789292 RepID=UPI002E28411B|nr:bifunctional 3'-5' exonuclease/DNA polymerase [Streptacidiphilus fuscans]